MIILLGALVAHAGPDTVVPDRAEVEACIDEAESLVHRAEETGVALATLHNQWAWRAANGSPVECGEELGLRIRAAGATHRDATQSARAQRDRMAAVVEVSTVAPLLSVSDLERVASVHERVEDQFARHLEAQAWSARIVEPELWHCRARTQRKP